MELKRYLLTNVETSVVVLVSEVVLTESRGRTISKGKSNPVADACECGNEPSGSVKCGEFLD